MILQDTQGCEARLFFSFFGSGVVYIQGGLIVIISFNFLLSYLSSFKTPRFLVGLCYYELQTGASLVLILSPAWEEAILLLYEVKLR